jgi:thermostable 8-oxoguanine DNA glycosylase
MRQPSKRSPLVPKAHERPGSYANWAALWRDYAADYERAVIELRPSDEDALYDELLFCLLSGHGVPFELALSAARHLAAFSVFSRRRTDSELRDLVLAELSRPQFEPRRKDGNFRRFRYPMRKTGLIVCARPWLLDQGRLYDRLRSIPDERARRTFLTACPGVGPKTASWLLRNAGLAHELAVLDVHVLRAMDNQGRLGSLRLPRDYERIEKAFLAWCRELQASPAAFDLFLWEVQRGDLELRAVHSAAA